MKKTLFAFLLAGIFIFPALSQAEATQASMNGSSGIIAIPSADTITERSMLVGSWVFLGGDDTVYGPRILFSFFPRWEIGAGIDIVPDEDTSAMFNTKINIYKTSGLDIALGFNYQMNARGKDQDYQDNQQLFMAFTWYGWGKTSMFFGKTFGDGSSKKAIDFGIGLEKELWAGSFGGIAFIFDFSNCGYRMLSPREAGDVNRGIFNGGLRILAFEKKLNIDLTFVDLLDEPAENFAISAAYRFSF